MSVTLDGEDEHALSAFSDPATAEHAALLSWAADRGIDPARLGSDASVLRALLRAGAQSLSERALDDGYAALAGVMTTRDRAEALAARGRHMERIESKAAE